MALDNSSTIREPETEVPADTTRFAGLPSRMLGCALLLGISLLIFRQPLETLIRMALDDQRHTHVILMPFISIGLIALSWRKVFANSRPDLRFGLALLLGGGIAFALGAGRASLPLEISAIVLCWIALFLIFFGRESLMAGRFPLAMLALFVPLPSAILDTGEVLLQRASADVTEVLFRAIGIPLFRDGLLFSIPGVIIEVARECSGIRSCIVLMIVSLVLSYLFLRSNWNRAIFVALAIPISIFKNAIRIVALSWLGTNVSMDFLTGDLHHRGGPIFSLISLGLMVPIFLGLRRLEGRHRPTERTPILTSDCRSKAS